MLWELLPLVCGGCNWFSRIVDPSHQKAAQKQESISSSFLLEMKYELMCSNLKGPYPFPGQRNFFSQKNKKLLLFNSSQARSLPNYAIRLTEMFALDPALQQAQVEEELLPDFGVV